MGINQCPLCPRRVSDWEMSGGKAKEVGGEIVHKTCLIDYKLRHGKDYEPPKEVTHEATSNELSSVLHRSSDT